MLDEMLDWFAPAFNHFIKSSTVAYKRVAYKKNLVYKDLCSSTQSVKEFLYGDDLSQVVKELNLTNKLGFRPINKYSYSRNRSYGNKGYYKQNSLLGRGQSNPYHEPWKQGRKYEKR